MSSEDEEQTLAGQMSIGDSANTSNEEEEEEEENEELLNVVNDDLDQPSQQSETEAEVEVDDEEDGSITPERSPQRSQSKINIKLPAKQKTAESSSIGGDPIPSSNATEQNIPKIKLEGSEMKKSKKKVMKSSKKTTNAAKKSRIEDSTMLIEQDSYKLRLSPEKFEELSDHKTKYIV